MDFTKLNTEVENIKNWLIKELSSLRTGTASISVLDNVMVENYGVPTPVNQVATINIEDAKSLKINTYDTSQVQVLEKAIIDADLGLSVAVDGSGVRLIFPDLTGERREELVKKAKGVLEQAKIRLKTEREKTWNEIQAQEKEGEMSQDEKFVAKENMQKVIDEGIKLFEEVLIKKELEIKG